MEAAALVATGAALGAGAAAEGGALDADAAAAVWLDATMFDLLPAFFSQR